MPDLHIADLSDWNPGADFAAYAASGRAGVILKVDEGTTFTANTFAPYRAAAHAAGLVVGLYHFAKAGDPAAEARHFLAAIGTLQPGELAILDAEVPGLSASWCRAWLGAVEAATGRMPLLYCSWSYWGDSLSSMTDCPLWIAAYHALGHDDPRDSVPGCVLWQYTDNAEIPGVGSGDDSVFRGSVDDLRALFGASPTPNPQPTPDPIEEPTMFAFWHQGAVYVAAPFLANGDVGLRRCRDGLPGFAVDTMIAAGVKIAGSPGDDRSDLMAATDPAK